MSVELPFDVTTGDIAREAGALPETVRLYADLGLLEHVKLPNGTRLFRRSDAARVREIRAARLANRGRRPVLDGTNADAA